MRLFALSLLGGLVLMAPSASALTPSECSAKFQEARKAGTLNGQRWNDFRAAQCGAGATPAAAPAATATLAAGQAAPAVAANPLKTAAPKPTGPLVFPKAISPAFASEKPASARRKTCGEQFRANKATGGNGGLRWIQPGGGYWSECNKSLKGA